MEKKQFEKLPYVAVGTHVFEVVDARKGKSGAGQPFFAADLKVVSSDTLEVGSKHSFFTMERVGNDQADTERKRRNFAQAVERFIAAAMGFPANRVTSQLVEKCVGPGKIVVGTKVGCVASPATNPKFTNYKWMSAETMPAADAAPSEAAGE